MYNYICTKEVQNNYKVGNSMSEYTVETIKSKYNTQKEYLVKHYKDGHYVANQKVKGKNVSPSYVRISKSTYQELKESNK